LRGGHEQLSRSLGAGPRRWVGETRISAAAWRVGEIRRRSPAGEGFTPGAGGIPKIASTVRARKYHLGYELARAGETVDCEGSQGKSQLAPRFNLS
jgi:hypothetical protein